MIRTAVVALGLLFSQVAHAATVDADVTIGNAVERICSARLCGAPTRHSRAWCIARAISAPTLPLRHFPRHVMRSREPSMPGRKSRSSGLGRSRRKTRLERILFWPDRKSIGLKQVQAALAAKDTSITDAGKLKGKSVAVQGLGALEFLLVRDGG